MPAGGTPAGDTLMGNTPASGAPAGGAPVWRGSISFEEQYGLFKNEIDVFLDRKLPAYEAEGQKLLGEAMRYSVSAGGKRIRGVLAMAVFELLDGLSGQSRTRLDRLPARTDRKQASDILRSKSPDPAPEPMEIYPRTAILTLAGAVEFIHAYSLIHDDMPCMDDDDYRRGKPSCHKAYGEGIAMLAGDALLNLAMELLLDQAAYISAESRRAPASGIISGLRFTEAAAYMARAAGAGGMAGGQAIDLVADIHDGERLKYMHRLKTGRLFDAAILAPAVCLRADADAYEALSRYGGALGCAFQIKDDLIDYQNEKSDAESRNYVSMFGVSRAEYAFCEACSDALNSLGGFSGEADFLRGMVKYISDMNA